MHRSLLLNDTYEPLSFIDFRRGIKLILKDKVDIICNWDMDRVHLLSGGFFECPSVLRLKHIHVKKVFIKNNEFSKIGLQKRDNNTCQYCGVKLEGAQITIDHILPKHQGGKKTFLNCVIACKPCNSRKGSKTPEQAKMKLLKEPIRPKLFQSLRELYEKEDRTRPDWNIDWNDFI